MMITNRTSLNMVIGYPLDHTQSPLLHNYIYKALNIDAILLAFPHKNIKTLVQAIKTLSVGLIAVTMPFKEQLLEHLDECKPEVVALKAANTIIQREGKLHGHNTDVDGIDYALRNVNLANKHILLLGAGGAARAVAYVAQKNKAKLLWLNRTKNKAKGLIKMFGGDLVDFNQVKNVQVDIIVNTTPLGMYPDVGVSPIPDYQFKPQQIVFDIVYNPLETQLLKQAKKSGAETVSGIDMFIGQGLKQIELWLDKKINTEKVIHEVKEALIKCSQENLSE